MAPVAVAMALALLLVRTASSESGASTPAVLHPLTLGQGSAHNSTPTSRLEALTTPQAREAFCDAEYADLFTNITFELRRWRDQGITLQAGRCACTPADHHLEARSSSCSLLCYVAHPC